MAWEGPGTLDVGCDVRRQHALQWCVCVCVSTCIGNGLHSEAILTYITEFKGHNIRQAMTGKLLPGER